MDDVAPGTHQITGYVNAYIVDGDQGVVLVDTGLPKKEGKVIQGLASIGRSSADVVAIVLTHAHSDHFGSAAALKSLTGAAVVAPTIDTPVIQGEGPLPVPPMLKGLGFLTRLFPTPDPVIVDLMVNEGAQTGMPDDFTVLDTPGHTPGHTSYLLDRAGGVLFVGDAAASDRSGAVTRGFPNTRGGPEIDASIRHLATHEFDRAVFGHSAPILEGASEVFRSYRR